MKQEYRKTQEKERERRMRGHIVDIEENILSLSLPFFPLYPFNPLCIVHIRRQRQAAAGRRQKVHEASQKDGRRWTGNKMKSATEFGARAESYSRTRRGPNSNNVFFALLVFSAFSAFPPAAAPPAFLEERKRRERNRGGGGKFHVSSIHGKVQYLAALRFIRENRKSARRGAEFGLKKKKYNNVRKRTIDI